MQELTEVALTTAAPKLVMVDVLLEHGALTSGVRRNPTVISYPVVRM